MDKCAADEFLDSKLPRRLVAGGTDWPCPEGTKRWGWSMVGDPTSELVLPEWLTRFLTGDGGMGVRMILYTSVADAKEAISTALADWRKENGHM